MIRIVVKDGEPIPKVLSTLRKAFKPVRRKCLEKMAYKSKSKAKRVEKTEAIRREKKINQEED